MLIALAGLPASGKSALAVQLRDEIPAVLLDKDSVRNFMFQDYIDYSREQNDLCVKMIYETISYLLSTANPPNVIIDGRTFSRRYQIEALMQAAAQVKSRLVIIECVCDDDTTKVRMADSSNNHPAQDRNFAMYLNVKKTADPITEQKLVINTAENSKERCLELAMAYLAAADRSGLPS